ncbi:uncharacterized protein LOC125040418 [Penaeus chinensis]|uniref:uncharacterized protein LOC125040418 n=1 Tax=Penaeus chinensis TaxID=139456 RepID=UPI001FB63AB7|nr:uncharacterized protein LOC125040418 [Penaeus chinensis]
MSRKIYNFFTSTLARHQSVALSTQEHTLSLSAAHTSQMASNALTPFMYQLQESLRNVDLRNFISNDLSNWFGKVDFKTVGFVALAALVVLLVLDLFTKSPTPFGRSLVSSVANAWDSADQTGLSQSLRGSRSLEPLATVLDALTKEVKKWEAPADSAVRNRAF